MMQFMLYSTLTREDRAKKMHKNIKALPLSTIIFVRIVHRFSLAKFSNRSFFHVGQESYRLPFSNISTVKPAIFIYHLRCFVLLFQISFEHIWTVKTNLQHEIKQNSTIATTNLKACLHLQFLLRC